MGKLLEGHHNRSQRMRSKSCDLSKTESGGVAKKASEGREEIKGITFGPGILNSNYEDIALPSGRALPLLEVLSPSSIKRVPDGYVCEFLTIARLGSRRGSVDDVGDVGDEQITLYYLGIIFSIDKSVLL